MIKARAPIAVLLTISLAMALASCGTLNVLQAVVDSTAAAVPILQAAGVPIPPQVPAYIAAVADCIGSVSGAPNPTQLATIAGCLAKQIAPTLPPGIPQAVANIVALIAQDVVNYLAANPAPVVGAVPAARAAKLSNADVAKFEMLRTKAQQTVVAIKALPKVSQPAPKK
jgi:hypothetical protein